MDSKTVIGYYFSSFNFLQGCAMYFFLFSISVGLFISLSVYVGAISEDFKAIIDEINEEIDSGNKKTPKSRKNKNDLWTKITEAILLHNEMIKYLLCYFLFEINVEIYLVFLSPDLWKTFVTYRAPYYSVY